MSDVLDSPVWHALTGPQAHVANGHGRARHFPRDMAPFSAIESSDPVSYSVAINQAVFVLAPAILGAVRGFASNYNASFGIAAVIQVAAASVVLLGRTGMSPDRGLADALKRSSQNEEALDD